MVLDIGVQATSPEQLVHFANEAIGHLREAHDGEDFDRFAVTVLVDRSDSEPSGRMGPPHYLIGNMALSEVVRPSNTKKSLVVPTVAVPMEFRPDGHCKNLSTDNIVVPFTHLPTSRRLVIGEPHAREFVSRRGHYSRLGLELESLTQEAQRAGLTVL